MNANSIVRIADHDTMMENLRRIDDDPKLVANFYPKLATLAGKTVALDDVVTTISAAISEYTMNEPDDDGLPMACFTLPLRASAYLEAMIDHVLPTVPAATA